MLALPNLIQLWILMVLTVIEVAAVYVKWEDVLDTTLNNAKLITWAKNNPP